MRSRPHGRVREAANSRSRYEREDKHSSQRRAGSRHSTVEKQAEGALPSARLFGGRFKGRSVFNFRHGPDTHPQQI